VKHQYDTWDKSQTKLKTCNPAAKVLVSHHQTPQEVVAGGEIIFTYDVKFEVSDFRSCISKCRFTSSI